MDPTQITHDACRSYLDENRPSLRPEVYAYVDGCLRSRNIKGLSELCDSYGVEYLTPFEFTTLRQVSAFYKKNVAFCDDNVALETARSAFVSAESRCRVTNRRLDHYYVNRDRLDPDVDLWCSRMEADIANLLGSFSDFLDSLPQGIRITGGASAQQPRSRSQPFAKVSKRMDCTPGAVKYLTALSKYWRYGKVRPRRVLHNRVEFVPKNWKTHRTIACEPTGNVPLQLAFDRYSKQRMLRWGINLRDQTVNQRKAQLGSMYGGLSTIDLSAASDTVSFNVVAWFLPKPFFDYLNDVRCPRYWWDGVSKTYSKFSSMGNGATFALESLLFTAACRAIGSKHYSVYGDDIVIETHLVPKLEKLFKFLGFSINREKSFTTGPFRESCGFDAYDGDNVTPFYIRELDNRKVTLVHFVNGMAAIARPEGMLAKYLKNLVRSERLPYVPLNENSMSGIHILDDRAIALGLIRPRRPKEKWVYGYLSYMPKVKYRRVEDIRTLFLWHLNRCSKDDAPITLSIFKGHSHVLEEGISVTLVPAFSHKYWRKWVRWKPAADVADHLYWWSEFLTRES